MIALRWGTGVILLAAWPVILWADPQNRPDEQGLETLGKPAPELMAAGWLGSPITLRGVKGNTVVLTFWNCDTNFFDSPEFFLREAMADYTKYAGLRNITFASVCISMTATLKHVERYVEQCRLHPFPTMLDAGGATAHAYKVPKNYGTWIVIIDSDGKILYNRNKGWRWSGGAEAGKMVHHTMIEDSQKKSPGILGRKTAPVEGELAAHLYDLQQFQLAELEIKKLEARKSTDEVKEFAAYLRDQIAQTRKKRLEDIQELSQSTPVRAYREAVAFVAAFPTSPERSPMNDLGKSLLQDPTVKKELQAEDAYRRIILPELVKAPKGTAEFTQRVQPALNAFLKMYGETEYAAAVTDGVEGYKLAVTTRAR